MTCRQGHRHHGGHHQRSHSSDADHRQRPAVEIILGTGAHNGEYYKTCYDKWVRNEDSRGRRRGRELSTDSREGLKRSAWKQHFNERKFARVMRRFDPGLRLGRLLGQGSFGRVFSAETSSTKGRVVVVKAERIIPKKRQSLRTELAAYKRLFDVVERPPGKDSAETVCGGRLGLESSAAASSSGVGTVSTTGASRGPSLLAFTGVPHLIFYWDDKRNYRAMVFDRMGPSLSALLAECGGRFSPRTCAMLAIQLLDHLEFIHGRGLVHRDIKPANLVVGFDPSRVGGRERRRRTEDDDSSTDGRRSHAGGSSGHRARSRSSSARTATTTTAPAQAAPAPAGAERYVYLIDFGLSKLYINPKDGRHLQHREGRGHAGTVKFMGLHTHQGHEVSRRDDLQSLAYTLTFLLRGNLPWWKQRDGGGRRSPHRDPCAERAKREYNRRHKRGVPFSKLSSDERVYRIKQYIDVDRMLQGYPSCFARLLKYALQLQFAHRPDYAQLRALFYAYLGAEEKSGRGGGRSQQNPLDFRYDWVR